MRSALLLPVNVDSLQGVSRVSVLSSDNLIQIVDCGSSGNYVRVDNRNVSQNVLCLVLSAVNLELLGLVLYGVQSANSAGSQLPWSRRQRIRRKRRYRR